MAASGEPPHISGPPPPLADVTARMAVFGRIFGEHAAAASPDEVPDADALVDLVRTMVPRSTKPEDDTPVFEAAAFLGEWVRSRVPAAWVVEGHQEPHLRAEDETGSIVYVLPLVAVVRLASTAGYDGLASSLQTLVADLTETPRSAPMGELRVRPVEDRPRVASWVAHHLASEAAATATLWRRCSACSTLAEEEVVLPEASLDVETLAAVAANALAERTFACVCGGPPGDSSRFLMLRGTDAGHVLVDICIRSAQTRIASWRIEDGRVLPMGMPPARAEAMR